MHLAFPGGACAGHCHSNSKHKAEPWALQEYPHVWPTRNWKNSICQGTHKLHNTHERSSHMNLNNCDHIQWFA